MLLEWNQAGQRYFEVGVDRGVFFPKIGPGVVWNGLVSVDTGVSGGEAEAYYFDGVKYMDFIANEFFQATIEAYAAPVGFEACDGSKQLSPGLYATQQPRKSFGMSFRTLIGNDLDDLTHGYKLHLVWNATVVPSSKSYASTKAAVEPGTRSWAVVTLPPKSSTFRPTSHFVIDSREVDPMVLQDLEDRIYGSATKTPELPTQAEVVSILSNLITEPLGALI